jgi:hypothetical protein
VAKKKQRRGKKNRQRDAEHFFDHEEDEASGKGVEFIDDHVLALLLFLRLTIRRFCQNSASGQNSIVPHLLRRSVHVLPTLPFHVRIQQKT